jgi:hypothetical protein
MILLLKRPQQQLAKKLPVCHKRRLGCLGYEIVMQANSRYIQVRNKDHAFAAERIFFQPSLLSFCVQVCWLGLLFIFASTLAEALGYRQMKISEY